MHLEDIYAARCREPSELHEHLPTLRRLASQCHSVVEFGVQIAKSTTAFLAAQPDRLTSVDIADCPEARKLAQFAGRTEFKFIQADSLAIEPIPCDLLFVDSLHTEAQLYGELTRHAGAVKRWIVLHDTVTFGWIGENSQLGLIPALLRFWRECRDWRLAEVYINNHGLLVLERLSAA